MTVKPLKKVAPTVEEAMRRLLNLPAIDLADLSVLMGVHVSTVQRAANRDDLPVPTARIGQRWIVPSAPVREMLHLTDAGTAA